ncbi:MAG: CDP-alcohol phosphatidyltransferase family protein [Deltaproteobacteria bacterium]|nr:CDP-alcohol phosphatidyltransferase family protein [Deltaproteobacteria bacterium]
MTWKTKPTDRFILRLIKTNLSAPISLALVRLFPGIRPGLITVLSSSIGISAGVAFGIGYGWLAGLLAAIAQVMDGVDGQTARLTGKVSDQGAFLDSVLDRYMDFALVFGIMVYCLRFSAGLEAAGFTLTSPWIVLISALATAGSSQVSYSTARAASLGLTYRRPELACKGTRTAVVIVSGLLSPLWSPFPLLALCYLAIHPNLAVLVSLVRLLRSQK